MAESLYSTKGGSYKEVRMVMEQNASGIENLVLEGAGAKTVCYLGVIKVLEDIGVLQRIRRFAGTGVAAIAAGLLAIGCNSADLDKFFVRDCMCGKLGLIPNLFLKLGRNPATKLLDLLRTIIGDKTGNPDLTFLQLYESSGMELCVVTTNLSVGLPEYCHVKTTPDLSIALAIRATCTRPGLVQPVRVERGHGITHLLVDGGLSVNNPIHCFDGWFLSMKREHSFIYHPECNARAFGEFNDKTLGISVYSGLDGSLLTRERITSVLHHIRRPRPKSHLAKSRGKDVDQMLHIKEIQERAHQAGHKLMKTLIDARLDDAGPRPLADYKRALVQEQMFSREDGKALFGPDFDVTKVFDAMSKSIKQEVTLDEFLRLLQIKAGCEHPLMPTGSSCYRDIEDLTEYLDLAFLATQQSNGSALVKEMDKERTLAICSDYIQTLDFNMEKEDKLYLYKIGMETAAEYFKNRDTNGAEEALDEHGTI